MSADDQASRPPDAVGGGADEPSVWVEFPGFDVEQLRTTQQWDDALVREAQLMVRGDPDGVRTDLEELRADLPRLYATAGSPGGLAPAALRALAATRWGAPVKVRGTYLYRPARTTVEATR